MKFFTVLFWALILGQVMGYILSALQGAPDDFKLVAIVSVVFAVVVYIIGSLVKPMKKA
ncbi:DUF2929 family protein [Streptococcaceae bacterium ESL0729]|nr:DUF2929 family protein [Streptococcaceae bacterium ESL0729]